MIFAFVNTFWSFVNELLPDLTFWSEAVLCIWQLSEGGVGKPGLTKQAATFINKALFDGYDDKTYKTQTCYLEHKMLQSNQGILSK